MTLLRTKPNLRGIRVAIPWTQSPRLFSSYIKIIRIASDSISSGSNTILISLSSYKLFIYFQVRKSNRPCRWWELYLVWEACNSMKKASDVATHTSMTLMHIICRWNYSCFFFNVLKLGLITGFINIFVLWCRYLFSIFLFFLSFWTPKRKEKNYDFSYSIFSILADLAKALPCTVSKSYRRGNKDIWNETVKLQQMRDSKFGSICW